VITSAGETSTDALAARVAEAHRRASMIVLAIGASIVLYVAIALYMVSLRQPRGLTEQTRYGFYIVPAFLALGSIFYRRAQMRRIRLEVVAGLRGIKGLLKHFFQVTIVSVAMADIIGLLALLVTGPAFAASASPRTFILCVLDQPVLLQKSRLASEKAAYFVETMPGIEE